MGQLSDVREAVQPRGRGERGQVLPDLDGGVGSAPRARGTRALRQLSAPLVRFSPAGAGNATTAMSRTAKTSVQPRGRGERLTGHEVGGVAGGSAPRARGTPRGRGQPGRGGRFSPAGAGNARRAPAPHPRRTVQPRGRGERGRMSSIASASVGSAPRARGTPCHRFHCCNQKRFSPAGAGNALRAQVLQAQATVQPRGRGERLLHKVPGCRGTGSAPRARGTPRRRLAHLVIERFSPAGAGNA